MAPAEYDYEKQEDKDGLDGLDESPSPQPAQPYGQSYVGGSRSWPRRVMEFLVKHGVESRGIEPVSEAVSDGEGWIERYAQRDC